MSITNKSASNDLRSPLARARGLGSAHEGLHHWWAQRLTALALIPLTVWFVAEIIRMVHGQVGGGGGASYEDFLAWLASPLNATLMIVFIAVAFHHAVLGMQVVIEDYVAGHGRRIASLIAVKLVCYGLAALAIVSTLIVCFGV
jgi:succinate dehydrogenase / fumarate reductase membrane anchor subunit